MPPMTREEHWRHRLIELLKALQLTQAAFAKIIEVDGSYVSRLLYPPGKAGRKNLGLDTMQKAREKFNLAADWFDLPLGAKLPSDDEGNQANEVDEVNEPERTRPRNVSPPILWPFPNVSYQRLMTLKRNLGRNIGHDAIKDIDSLLDVAVSKWERVAASQKSRQSAIR